MKISRVVTRCRLAALAILGILILAPCAWSADPDAEIPRNIGRGLREIAQWSQQGSVRSLAFQERNEAIAAHIREAHPRAQLDEGGRMVVDVILNGAVPVPAVSASLSALGLKIITEHGATLRSGSAYGRISAWMPPSQVVAAAAVPGVQSVLMVHRPWHRVGSVTSQGVNVLKANSVMSLGFTGSGIRVGVISDSYNLTSPHAAADVASGDLPAGVSVLGEGSGSDNTDEGRAMLQIVHDMAPGAALAFYSCGQTQGTFASAITALRTSASSPCDIICDDIGFTDEPMFSDGIVAQAADEAVTSTTLAGRPAIFYSASGNDAGQGYEADWKPVSFSVAQASTSVNLSQVPSYMTAGGFHNFAAANGDGGTVVVQTVTVNNQGYTGNPPVELDFQWNDLFIPGAVTTDYYLLVFSGGVFQAAISGTDQATLTGEACQLVDLPATSRGKTYQLVISRGTTGTTPATHFRYTVDPSPDAILGNYVAQNVPSVYGHTGARNVDAVGAYYWNFISSPENYSSFGPVSIYFDDAGNRLAKPEVRLQPTISGVDGVSTTFFDSPSNPVFYGTSAAAPHAAGVAALLLQAAGGPGSISPVQMRGLLESTAARYSSDALLRANGWSPSAGFGLVNALTALNTASANSFKAAPLGNISTRLLVKTGSQVGIAGFIVTGSSPKQLLIRAIGPSLTALGVPGALANPTLELHDASSLIATNDNWQTQVAGSIPVGTPAQIQATGRPPGNAMESALLVTLNPGAYTAIVQGGGGGTGVGLVEVYDLAPGPSVKLGNISTRGLVSGGANVMIAGFIIPPGKSKHVIIKAIGPDLGVSGSLTDPNLTLYDQNGYAMAFNLHWGDTQQAAIRSSGQAPGNANDSAILVDLVPGAYTAIVRSQSGGVGVARVDVIDLDP